MNAGHASVDAQSIPAFATVPGSPSVSFSWVGGLAQAELSPLATAAIPIFDSPFQQLTYQPLQQFPHLQPLQLLPQLQHQASTPESNLDAGLVNAQSLPPAATPVGSLAPPPVPPVAALTQIQATPPTIAPLPSFSLSEVQASTSATIQATHLVHPQAPPPAATPLVSFVPPDVPPVAGLLPMQATPPATAPMPSLSPLEVQVPTPPANPSIDFVKAQAPPPPVTPVLSQAPPTVLPAAGLAQAPPPPVTPVLSQVPPVAGLLPMQATPPTTNPAADLVKAPPLPPPVTPVASLAPPPAAGHLQIQSTTAPIPSFSLSDMQGPKPEGNHGIDLTNSHTWLPTTTPNPTLAPPPVPPVPGLTQAQAQPTVLTSMPPSLITGPPSETCQQAGLSLGSAAPAQSYLHGPRFAGIAVPAICTSQGSTDAQSTPAGKSTEYFTLDDATSPDSASRDDAEIFPDMDKNAQCSASLQRLCDRISACADRIRGTPLGKELRDIGEELHQESLGIESAPDIAQRLAELLEEKDELRRAFAGHMATYDMQLADERRAREALEAEVIAMRVEYEAKAQLERSISSPEKSIGPPPVGSQPANCNGTVNDPVRWAAVTVALQQEISKLKEDNLKLQRYSATLPSVEEYVKIGIERDKMRQERDDLLATAAATSAATSLVSDTTAAQCTALSEALAVREVEVRTLNSQVAQLRQEMERKESEHQDLLRQAREVDYRSKEEAIATHLALEAEITALRKQLQQQRPADSSGAADNDYRGLREKAAVVAEESKRLSRPSRSLKFAKSDFAQA